MERTYTTYHGKFVTFDVIVDNTIHSLISEEIKHKNKVLFSLVNDFEDGSWRIKIFNKYIWDNIKETALSQDEKNALIGDELSSLTKSANNLRLTRGEDDEKGGEIGEILLYGIMRDYYSALPVVPKIFYKQNKNDYAKGADSVHIVLEEENVFSIWLGEAKFYNELNNTRYNKILTSVENTLSSEKLRKELNIVTSLKDLKLLIKDDNIYNEIYHKLSDGISLDIIKKQLHIPILLLHECQLTAENTAEIEQYKKKLFKHHLEIAKEFIEKQDSKLENIHGYEEIKFHLILFPVPNKNEIVNNFIKKVKFFKD